MLTHVIDVDTRDHTSYLPIDPAVVSPNNVWIIRHFKLVDRAILRIQSWLSGHDILNRTSYQPHDISTAYINRTTFIYEQNGSMVLFNDSI